MTQLTALEWGDFNFCQKNIMSITNEFELEGVAGTSGQPEPEQFADIASRGYQVIVNLAMPDSKGAIGNEGEIVSSLGMAYIHLPVEWDMPTVDDVITFFGLMNSLKHKKVWVHCALNWRVSSFVYLYRLYMLGHPEEDAKYPLKELWEPNETWESLFIQVHHLFDDKDIVET